MEYNIEGELIHEESRLDIMETVNNADTPILDKVYAIHRGNGQKYLHWQLLWNNEKTGYIQQLQPVETQVFKLFETASSSHDTLDTKKTTDIYKQAESIISAAYRQLGTY